jgi:hypothetical protein
MKTKMKSEYKIFLKPNTEFCIRFVKWKMKTIFDLDFRNGSVKFIGCFYRSQNFSGPVPTVRALFMSAWI